MKSWYVHWQCFTLNVYLLVGMKLVIDEIKKLVANFHLRISNLVITKTPGSGSQTAMKFMKFNVDTKRCLKQKCLSTVGPMSIQSFEI